MEEMNGVRVNMITQRTADPEQFHICPFDHCHRISAKRFVTHVRKCQKNFPHIELETCPFNAIHIMEPPKMRHHISTCPDRHTLELNQQSLGQYASATNSPAASAPQNYEFSDDESWDDDDSRIQNASALDSFDRAFLNGATNRDKATVEQIKLQMKKHQERASQAQALPSRRPVSGTGNKLSGAVGGLIRQPVRANNDNDSRMRPRLAANFAMRPDSPESRGRGWFMYSDRDGYAVGRGRALTASFSPGLSGRDLPSTVVHARNFAAMSEERGDSDV